MASSKAFKDMTNLERQAVYNTIVSNYSGKYVNKPIDKVVEALSDPSYDDGMKEFIRLVVQYIRTCKAVERKVLLKAINVILGIEE